jgi:hypothetical protein
VLAYGHFVRELLLRLPADDVGHDPGAVDRDATVMGGRGGGAEQGGGGGEGRGGLGEGTVVRKVLREIVRMCSSPVPSSRPAMVCTCVYMCVRTVSVVCVHARACFLACREHIL